jgi:hypothetical protein
VKRKRTNGPELTRQQKKMLARNAATSAGDVIPPMNRSQSESARMRRRVLRSAGKPWFIGATPA